MKEALIDIISGNRISASNLVHEASALLI